MILKIKNCIYKGPAQYRKRKLSGSGFVILFAVTISSILLAIALGVSNIALKEIKFGTSAKDTNEAFFAADSAVEYVLFHDKLGASDYPVPAVGASQSSYWVVSGLGNSGLNCATAAITKNNTTPPVKTTIISKGYNVGDAACTWGGQNRIERELKISY